MIYNDFKKASSDFTNENELHELSTSKNSFVRSAVALNQNTCQLTLKSLSNDTCKFVVRCLELRTNWVCPKLTKPETIFGRHIQLRNVNCDDSEFIVFLRTSEKKARYISKTSPEISLQRKWLELYAADEKQTYFIVEDKGGRSIGTVRLYDVTGHSFCWGSWVLSEEAPKLAAIESAILIYEFARSQGFLMSHFDVRKENTSVCKFHERFGATCLDDNHEDYFYMIDDQSIDESIARYKSKLRF